MFPGLYCPGLIEAPAGAAMATASAPCFRGSIAPASLKRGGRLAFHHRHDDVFPGLYCPGLIEAQLLSRPHGGSLGVFPGLYCPGLIEAAQ